MSYDNWNLVTLQDVCLKIGDGLHGTPKYSEDGDYFFINGNNLNGKITIDDKTKKIGQDQYEKYKKELSLRTIFLSINGTLGKTAYYNKEKIVLGKSACYLNVKEDVYKDYIYYSLKTPQFIAYLNNHSTGTTIKNFGLKAAREYELKLPALQEQKAIASILSSLDNKIELNNKINNNLEEMAQSLYKQWFVDFEFPNEDGEPYKSSGGEMIESELGLIPKGWEVKSIKTLMSLIKDSTRPGVHLKDRVYTPIDVLPKKELIISNFKSYEEANSGLLLYSKYDILIGAMRVYFHRVNLAPFNGITRTTTFVIRSKKDSDVSFNLLLLNQESTIEYANGTSRGSTMPYAVWENGLGEFVVANPLNSTKTNFHKIIKPILDTLMINVSQNRSLSELRDILLPKLMSGELRVPYEE